MDSYTTPKERDTIDILTQRKIAVRVRLLHYQRARRALDITIRLADAAQADIAMSDTSGAPIDKTLVRMKNSTQLSLTGIDSAIERAQAEIADCNAKIADVQRKAHKRAEAAAPEMSFDIMDQDIRHFLTTGTPDE